MLDIDQEQFLMLFFVVRSELEDLELLG